MKPFDYLIDLVEDMRHAFMAVRHDITRDEAVSVTQASKALITASRRKAEREQEKSLEELNAAAFLQGQFEAAVAIFSFQENM